MSDLLIMQAVPKLIYCKILWFLQWRFGVRFRDESIYALRGDGTKIKTSKSRDVSCYFLWMLGWFNMSSGRGTDDMSWAAFKRTRLEYSQQRFGLIWYYRFLRIILQGLLGALCLTKTVLRWARSLWTWVHRHTSQKSNVLLIAVLVLYRDFFAYGKLPSWPEYAMFCICWKTWNF